MTDPLNPSAASSPSAPRFRRGSSGPPLSPFTLPDHVVSEDARRIRAAWHKAFNWPDAGKPLGKVRCAHCPRNPKLGEIRWVDDALVLGVRSPDGVYRHFELLHVKSGRGAASRQAADEADGALCEHHLEVRATDQRSAIRRTAERSAGRQFTARV